MNFTDILAHIVLIGAPLLLLVMFIEDWWKQR